MRKLHFVFAVSICLLAFVPEMFGQPAAPKPSSEGWQVQIIPYLWGTSIDGRIGVGDRTANVDASFSNILDHLRFAFMNLADATWNNKLVLLTDLVYSDLAVFVQPQARSFRVLVRTRNYSFSLRKAVTECWMPVRRRWTSSVAFVTGI